MGFFSGVKVKKQPVEAFEEQSKEVNFEVLSAETTVSKSGNPMVSLRLATYEEDQNSREVVFEYLLEGGKFSWKVKSFLESIGRLDWHETNNFETSDVIGLTGKCIIKMQAGTNGYKDKWVVAKYIPNPEQQAQGNATEHPALAPPKPAADDFDDLPF